MPWSAELRTRWTSGSPNSSIIRLSNSVFSPAIVQPDLFSSGPRDVADDAIEAGEQRADGHHADVHDALLDAVADAVELVDGLEQIAHRVAGLVQRLDLVVQRFEVVADPPDLAPEQLQFRVGVRVVDPAAPQPPNLSSSAETLLST